VLITISGTMAMHMFLPAMPQAARSLGVGSAELQMTVTVYVVGLACGQLLYGPLSDGLGRRPLLMAGLLVYTLAGVVAALAPDVNTLIGARLFQALGGCAGLALGRAIVRDMASPGEAVKDLALLNLMMTIGPGLAPILGSWLNAAFGWRSILMLLAGLGAITLLFTWRLLPETGQPAGQVRMGAMLGDFRRLFRSPSFMGFAMGGGFVTASVYAFIASVPFIVVTELHRPEHEVGLYLGVMVLGAALGSGMLRYLVRRISVDRLLMGANLVSLSSSLALLLITLFSTLTPILVFLLSFPLALGLGVASPATLTKGLGSDPNFYGSAAGLYGALQMAVAALGTLLAMHHVRTAGAHH
jgi:DHA1 family bicyclomycin/chloramphenicol resistance-like MFS transporter